jgi:hypothetical protein
MVRIPFKIQLSLFGDTSPSGISGKADLPERGLMIRDPYITDILLQRKIWEIRGRRTKVRGRIGLIKSGAQHIFGEATLTDVIGPMLFQALLDSWQIGPHDQAELQIHQKLPYVTSDGKSKTFAWIFENIICYEFPIPYRHPSGAVTFVDLKKATNQ